MSVWQKAIKAAAAALSRKEDAGYNFTYSSFCIEYFFEDCESVWQEKHAKDKINEH